MFVHIISCPTYQVFLRLFPSANTYYTLTRIKRCSKVSKISTNQIRFQSVEESAHDSSHPNLKYGKKTTSDSSNSQVFLI